MKRLLASLTQQTIPVAGNFSFTRYTSIPADYTSIPADYTSIPADYTSIPADYTSSR